MQRGPVTTPSTDPPPLSDALTFLRVLWAVTHGLESTSKRMLKRLGVTGPQRLVLRIVGHHGRISAGKLAEVLHIHPSSLTGMLQRLEQAELIRRESDPLDRRRAIFELTRRGSRLNDQRRGTIEEAVANALTEQSPKRIAETKILLQAIAEALETASPVAKSKSKSESAAPRGKPRSSS